MKKIIFITIFKILLLHFGYAQNQFVAKMIIPGNSTRGLLKMNINSHPYHTVSKKVYAAEPAENTALFFNDQPVLKFNKKIKLPVLFLTELSFNDVLESSVNGCKPGLINTYDDHITELFKDAPSLFKLKFILPL